MAKTRKSNTEFEMNTGANESVAKASKKKEMESTEKHPAHLDNAELACNEGKLG